MTRTVEAEAFLHHRRWRDGAAAHEDDLAREFADWTPGPMPTAAEIRKLLAGARARGDDFMVGAFEEELERLADG